MKRILHLLDTTGPGGAENVFLNLVTGLGAGWVNIPVVPAPGWVETSVREAGLDPLLVNSTRRFDLPYLAALGRVIRDQRVDLVQAHLFSTTLYGSLAGRLRGIPVVGTFHGESDLGATGVLGSLRFKLIRTCSRKVVCVSSSLKELTLKTAGFRPGDLEVIPNGIDTSLFSPGDAFPIREALNLPPETFLVGAVGNVRPAKDYPTLLRAARAVQDSVGAAVHFVVVGETTPPLFDDLMALRSQLGLEGGVTFMGFREDVPDLLRGLDLFLLTSTYEGFSLVTVQAMATGLPVVATRAGGPEEILTHGVDGVLCAVSDPEAIAAAILGLKADPGRRRELSTKARETARDRFSREAMVRAYENLYRRILGGGDGTEAPRPGEP